MTTPGRDGSARNASGLSGAGSAAWYAERALLGALLHQPDRLDQVVTWLRPEDFWDPAHRAVFATVAGLHDAGELPSVDDTRVITQNVLAVRDAMESHRFSATGTGIARDLLPELFRDGAGLTEPQYTRYGQMVLDMSARRQIEAWGVLLERAAGPDMTVDDDLTALHQTHDAVMNNLADLDAQARRSTGQVIKRLAEPAGPVPIALPSTPLPSTLIEQAERRVINAVLAGDPTWRESGLLQRLRPEDFAGNPAHAATWQAIQSLAGRGHPIDPITVAWQTELIPDGEQSALPAAALMAMREPPTGDVARAISTVARSALHHHASTARQQLRTAAADRAASLGEVISAAQDAATALQDQANRLVTTPRPSSSLSRTLAGESTVAAQPPPSPLTRGRSR
jgi:hypothetical protein